MSSRVRVCVCAQWGGGGAPEGEPRRTTFGAMYLLPHGFVQLQDLAVEVVDALLPCLHLLNRLAGRCVRANPTHMSQSTHNRKGTKNRAAADSKAVHTVKDKQGPVA